MTATNMNTFNSYQCGRNCMYFDLFSLIYWKTTSCFTLDYNIAGISKHDLREAL